MVIQVQCRIFANWTLGYVGVRVRIGFQLSLALAIPVLPSTRARGFHQLLAGVFYSISRSELT